MNRRTVLLLGAFAAMAAATPAEGQKKPVRTGTATSAPPAQPMPTTSALPPAPNPAAQPMPTAAPIYGANQVPITQVTWYPTLVLADGRVLANFGTGRGYEEVLRQCPDLSGPLPPNVTIAPCFTKDSYGTYRVMQRR